MKAVILVGGEGTRMRPLTETVPKPLLPLMDRRCARPRARSPRRGTACTRWCSPAPVPRGGFHPFIEARHGDPAITWITETHALGTGGAIVNALEAAGDEPFFALNGDILTDLDLTAMRAFHEQTAAAVTIALHHVDDARAFGLVATDGDGRVLEFREKPEDPIPGDVNAGTYLLDPAVLAGGRPARAHLDRARHLPGGDRGGPPGLRVRRRRLLARSRHPGEVPAGAFRHVRGQGARRDATRRRGSPRAPTSTCRRISGRWVAVGAGATIGADAHGRGLGAASGSARRRRRAVSPGRCSLGRRRRRRRVGRRERAG